MVKYSCSYFVILFALIIMANDRNEEPHISKHIQLLCLTSDINHHIIFIIHNKYPDITSWISLQKTIWQWEAMQWRPIINKQNNETLSKVKHKILKMWAAEATCKTDIDYFIFIQCSISSTLNFMVQNSWKKLRQTYIERGIYWVHIFLVRPIQDLSLGYG